MKKIIALACTLVMLVSMFTISASAAVDGYSVTLDFTGYEVKGTTTFAVVNVNMTIGDTLVPYTMTPADWETTFEDSYTGLALQGMTIEIPKVDGLAYVGSLSTINEPVAMTDGATTYKLAYANTGDPATYYAGDLNKTIATLYFRITGDVDATYNVAANYAMVKYYSWTGSSTATPILHETGDFTMTGAVVEPEVEEPKYEDVEETIIEDAIVADTTTMEDYENYALYVHSFEAPADVKSVDALGFKVEGKNDVTFSAAITGAVKYIVAYVGAGAETAVVKPFYTVTKTVEVTE